MDGFLNLKQRHNTGKKSNGNAEVTNTTRTVGEKDRLKCRFHN